MGSMVYENGESNGTCHGNRDYLGYCMEASKTQKWGSGFRPPSPPINHGSRLLSRKCRPSCAGHRCTARCLEGPRQDTSGCKSVKYWFAVKERNLS